MWPAPRRSYPVTRTNDSWFLIVNLYDLWIRVFLLATATKDEILKSINFNNLTLVLHISSSDTSAIFPDFSVCLKFEFQRRNEIDSIRLDPFCRIVLRYIHAFVEGILNERSFNRIANSVPLDHLQFSGSWPFLFRLSLPVASFCQLRGRNVRSIPRNCGKKASFERQATSRSGRFTEVPANRSAR